MTVIGWHASHEQLHPKDLLIALQHAEKSGFTAAMCSDHFAPWSERQGHSGFAWSWLGAALQATDLPIGIVNAPGQRYHPAIIAQAVGTLEAMFPGRFWAALGSGEAMNEHITGDAWPRKEHRNERLQESVAVIRALLAGEEVSHDGHITVDRARLWTRPDTPPPLLAAAVSPQTAAWAAKWADGLATVNQSVDALRDVVEAYRGAGGTGPLVLQVHVSYAASEDEALQIAHDQWRTNVFSPPLCWDLDSVEAFDIASKHVTPNDVRGSVLISSDLGEYVDQLKEFIALGFDEVYLHQVGSDQRSFIEAFGEHVLPRLTVTAKAEATPEVVA
ncbi:TIGR03885 family FMN-dependent LLM class oxidoreductase [Homoserinimonas hongtaonis]|uniref:TIGR03885 family FMN-dependent LLM class oxidoreductase n=1 Tax=Homoserinimonas hongtaonis TaxID=2079791 RepID=UPI000D371A07|nr:TIGR03885 family FMN-dependent LLM class oxidoreductase [Salinibacterium hongtaonis]AWB89625.1 LLM class F420-dependent oxidoreductase [Salinibacterium hongtaonis]